jgi:hypothetical protein
VSAAYIYSLLRLPWLASDITTAIVNGRKPLQLTAQTLMGLTPRLTALRHARKGNPGRKWAMRLLERKRPKVVAVALANKTARIAWALLLRIEHSFQAMM